MNFVKASADMNPIVDTVFAIVTKAKEAKALVGEENVVDATIGSLYDESGKLVAYKSVFDNYNAIENRRKAGYAASFTGNPGFRQRVKEWTLDKGNCTLASTVIATPGGSGAISITIGNILDINETLIIPDIAWGSYSLMAKDKGLKTKTYEMFEGNSFNMKSFKETVSSLVGKQNRILVIINDPCHNPTGYSMTHEEWKEVISFLNECGKKTPCVILNDIAYIDYAYGQDEAKNYMQLFNDINDNVMVVVAFSCSKTLTSYGLRCGGAVICAQSKESVRQAEIVFEKTARAIWSNIPNAAMDNFTEVTTTHLDEFLNEKQFYVDLLKQRSEIFMEEADACGLVYYPYKEGFFVTVKVEDNARKARYHEALMKEHIYTVQVNKGIRVAVCSLSVDKCKGLAKRMKDILDQCE